MMTTGHMTTTTYTTQAVLSQDGAKISYLSMGSGPSVLVIPGALSIAAGYAAFASALSEHFSVHIIERRGRDLLPENLREHREVARLDSSYENYREIPADVLLMYGGKSQSNWVDLSMNRLAEILPRSEIKEFPKLDHFGIDKKAPREVAQAVNAYFREGLYTDQ